MSRQLRIQYPGAFYHVMNHGSGKQWLYSRKVHLDIFRRILAATVKKYQLKLHAAVLMRNHYHLLLETPSANLSQAMLKLNRDFSKKYNWASKRKGRVFRGRYKAILIEKETYYLSVLRYLCQNPVRKGIVSKCEAYDGSFLQWGQNNDTDQIYWKTIRDYFGSDGNWYRKFIAWINDSEERNPYVDLKCDFFLGTDPWIKGMGKILKGKNLAGISGRQKYKSILLNQAKLIQLTNQLDIRTYILSEYGGLKSKEIRDRLDIKSAAAVNQRLYRVRKKMEKDTEYRQYILGIADRVTKC